MPEEPPRKEREGATTAGGTGAEGRATSNPREPAATDRTQREDRRAKAARPTPNRPEATENTSREEEAPKKERTAASTPRAHLCLMQRLQRIQFKILTLWKYYMTIINFYDIPRKGDVLVVRINTVNEANS